MWDHIEGCHLLQVSAGYARFDPRYLNDSWKQALPAPLPMSGLRPILLFCLRDQSLSETVVAGCGSVTTAAATSKDKDELQYGCSKFYEVAITTQVRYVSSASELAPPTLHWSRKGGRNIYKLYDMRGGFPFHVETGTIIN